MRWAARTPDPAKRRAPSSAADRATRTAGALPVSVLLPVASSAINAACEAVAASAECHRSAFLADRDARLRRWSAEARQSRSLTVEA